MIYTKDTFLLSPPGYQPSVTNGSSAILNFSVLYDFGDSKFLVLAERSTGFNTDDITKTTQLVFIVGKVVLVSFHSLWSPEGAVSDQIPLSDMPFSFTFRTMGWSFCRITLTLTVFSMALLTTMPTKFWRMSYWLKDWGENKEERSLVQIQACDFFKSVKKTDKWDGVRNCSSSLSSLYPCDPPYNCCTKRLLFLASSRIRTCLWIM